MRTLQLFLMLCFVTATLSAQQQMTWIGGTPGNETDWHEPRNWSNNKVPDQFSNVLIPDVSFSSFAAPVIEEGVAEVSSITLVSKGELTVASGARLIVFDWVEGDSKIQTKDANAMYVVEYQKGNMLCSEFLITYFKEQ